LEKKKDVFTLTDLAHFYMLLGPSFPLNLLPQLLLYLLIIVTAIICIIITTTTGSLSATTEDSA
jgi:hypothetical protein